MKTLSKDPTAEEMREYLQDIYGDELCDFDMEGAIYWFAYSWHGGQNSNLYSALSTSEFHPGPCCKGPEKDSMEEMAYKDLVAGCGFSEEEEA